MSSLSRAVVVTACAVLLLAPCVNCGLLESECVSSIWPGYHWYGTLVARDGCPLPGVPVGITLITKAAERIGPVAFETDSNGRFVGGYGGPIADYRRCVPVEELEQGWPEESRAPELTSVELAFDVNGVAYAVTIPVTPDVLPEFSDILDNVLNLGTIVIAEATGVSGSSD